VSVLIALLNLILHVFSRDLAGLLGACLIWVTGSIWVCCCLALEVEVPQAPDGSFNGQLARYIVARFGSVIAGQFVLSSLWVGFVSEHWFLIAVLYGLTILIAFRWAVGPEAIARPISSLGLVAILSSMLVGLLVRLLLFSNW